MKHKFNFPQLEMPRGGKRKNAGGKRKGAGAPVGNSNSLGNKGGAAPVGNSNSLENKGGAAPEVNSNSLGNKGGAALGNTAPRRMKRKQTHYLRKAGNWSAMEMISERCLNIAK